MIRRFGLFRFNDHLWLFKSAVVSLEENPSDPGRFSIVFEGLRGQGRHGLLAIWPPGISQLQCYI